MATGDIVQKTSLNAGPNQRLDLVDILALAESIPGYLKAALRSLMSSPNAVAGVATGELWQGTITANPTPSDGILQVDSALLVGVDSDGGEILKPDGTALSVAITDDSSNYQVYLYTVPTTENTQVRRFIPVAAPFVEFSAGQDVSVRDIATMYLRAGDTASAVYEDVIGSRTVPLLYLGFANNTGGVVTFTPASNRLETVTAPGALPTSSTGSVAGTTFSTGDSRTLREFVNVAMHAQARNRWLGSTNYTATAANNYGAYTEPPAGLDVAVRAATQVLTIGDDAAGVYGQFDRDAYASDDLCLAAVIALAGTTPTTVLIQHGVTLDNFAGDVTIPASAKLSFASVSELRSGDTTFDMSDYTFMCASGGTAGFLGFERCHFDTSSATTDGNLIELHDQFTFVMRQCRLSVDTVNTGTPLSCVRVNAATTDLAPITIEDCTLNYATLNTADSGGRFLLDTQAVPAANVTVRNVECLCNGDTSAANYGGTVVYIGSAGSDIDIDNCEFRTSGIVLGGDTTLVNAVVIINTVITEGFIERRRVHRCKFTGRSAAADGHMSGVLAIDAVNLEVTHCQFDRMALGVAVNVTLATRLDMIVSDNKFRNFFDTGDALLATPAAALSGFTFDRNTVSACKVRVVTAAALSDIFMADNQFNDCVFVVSSSTTMDNVALSRNTFHSEVDTLLPPTFGTSTTSVGHLLFSRNTVRGYHTTTSDDMPFGVHISGTNIDDLDVSDNKFYDLQQGVVYTGLNPVNNWHVIRLEYDTGGVISVSRNEYHNISSGNSVSGAGVLRDVLLIALWHLVSQVGSVGSVIIRDNVMSDPNSSVSILHDRLHNVDDMQITNNSFKYDRSLVTPGGSGCFTIHRDNVIGALGGSFRFSGNTLNRYLSADHFVRLTGGGNFHFSTVQIVGNTFDSRSGDLSGPERGLYFENTHAAVVLQDNVSVTWQLSVDTTTAGSLSAAILPTNYPAVTGTAIDDNINFRTLI